MKKIFSVAGVVLGLAFPAAQSARADVVVGNVFETYALPAQRPKGLTLPAFLSLSRLPLA